MDTDGLISDAELDQYDQLADGEPPTHWCENCGAIFWDGNRRGHWFNGDDIQCPEPPWEDEQHND